MDDASQSSSYGLLRCLQALAEEAASLNMHHTFSALRDAILACRLDCVAAMAGQPAREPARH